MHNECNRRHKILCLVGCHFLWEKSTNIINEFTHANCDICFVMCLMHNACYMHMDAYKNKCKLWGIILMGKVNFYYN